MFFRKDMNPEFCVHKPSFNLINIVNMTSVSKRDSFLQSYRYCEKDKWLHMTLDWGGFSSGKDMGHLVLHPLFGNVIRIKRSYDFFLWFEKHCSVSLAPVRKSHDPSVRQNPGTSGNNYGLVNYEQSCFVFNFWTSAISMPI